MKYWISALFLSVAIAGFTLNARDGEREGGDRERRDAPRERPERDGDREQAEGKRDHDGARENARREHGDREGRPSIERHAAMIREKANRLRRYIESLERSGNKEDADKARKQLAELEKQLERLQQHQRGEGDGPRHQGDSEGGDNAGHEQRLRHLRAAIENLKAAGLHELAQQLQQRAMHAQRELGDRRPGPREGERRGGPPREGGRPEGQSREGEHRDEGRPPPGHDRELFEVIQNLQKQMEELRKEVNHLRERGGAGRNR